MAQPKTIVIDMPEGPGKWLTLLTYLQNRIPDTFVLEFPNVAAAKQAAYLISRALSNGVPGCHMISTQRERCVYIVKIQNAQKVIIRED